MKEIVNSYLEALGLYNTWGSIPYVINVSPEVFSIVEDSEIIQNRFFEKNDSLKNDEYLEIPYGN